MKPPNRLLAAGLALAALAGGAATLLPGVWPAKARAQDPTHTLYISGLHVGKKFKAIVRLTNISPDGADAYTVNYRVRDAATATLISRPGLAAELRSGRTLELDLGVIVTAYRDELEINPKFTAPVQFLAVGEGGFFRPFSPETVAVEAFQTDGKATYAVNVKWVEN